MLPALEGFCVPELDGELLPELELCGPCEDDDPWDGEPFCEDEGFDGADDGDEGEEGEPDVEGGGGGAGVEGDADFVAQPADSRSAAPRTRAVPAWRTSSIFMKGMPRLWRRDLDVRA
ncbi:hypothetical protein DFR24_0942 [Panacagrimonas perspica]|uniref:Uncharacterized protein n=1 Tax=Panacagrimonas perspica TaxID=381431 RepID=A0A4S3K5A7_9GAMM|nr:hypothetical protein [Panacagrimonas perspica]TDU31572.1 hypothetical protein DFR24_0942 [Panacagrimonas perspica]THD03198.1 hypothetical protein B1810_11535 [Panacagrimonas perspica]